MQPLQNSKDRGLFGRLCAGEKKLQGKTFYLDNVKPRSTMLLLEAISLLGGTIESFLHKDVNFVVTGSQDTIKEVKSEVIKGGAKGTSEGIQQQPNKHESGLGNDKRRTGTPRTMPCGSRGKALLEKAICNKEHLQKNNMLTNAQSWGVKILYVDDVLLYLKQLTRESFSIKHKRTEKTPAKQGSVKAAALRSPYLKIEDVSRKYKPLHMQSMTFPSLYYSGRFSPFESPPPPRFDKQMDLGDDKREKKAENCFQEESQTPLSCNPSPWRPRKKNSSYCECCYQTFSNLDEHLQSDQHRSFVLELSNYTAVDQLVAEMLPGFDPDPSQQPAERPPTPLPIHDVCELEPLTDVETEHAVEILLKEDSSFITHISDPPQSQLSSRPASPAQEVPFTTPDSATVPADLQPSNPDTNHQSTQFQSHRLSPLMPVLTLETFENQLKTLSSCSDDPCLLSDPYSQPPVLSPQAPYSLDIMNHQSPYPEPPILSPQKYTTEESFKGRACEMNLGDSESLSTLFQISGTSAEEKREPNPEVPVGHTGGVCSSRDLECVPQSSRSSYSLPQLLAVGPKSKKRCRLAGLEQGNLKRRRTMMFRRSGSRCNASKPPNENVSKVKDCSFCDNASDQMVESSPNSVTATSSTSRFVDVHDLKPSTFSFPNVQNFTPAPNQISSVPPLDGDRPQNATTSHCSHSHAVSVCIEPALIPDLATLSSALSDSDWDCDLLSRLGPTSATSLMHTEQNCELDKDLLHRSCPWMRDATYESHLHTVLQPSTPAASLCGESADSSPFSRTVVQIVEVQH